MIEINPEKIRDISWDFNGADTKKHVHCFHSYPAKMIPQVAGRILEEYGKNAKLLFDPYCGTGTSLVEANLRNINAIGTDINPLARLISKVKTTVIPLKILDFYLEDFKDFLLSVKLNPVEVKPEIPNFKNINYWFKKETQYRLALIKEYFKKIKNKDVQDFFKVAFSETVREVSLTRNGEFKLYRMNFKQMQRFNPDVFSIMTEKLIRNRNGMAEYISMKKNEAFSLIYDFNTVYQIPENLLSPCNVDIVITSPPYGDSKTTVAYGQFSRLSNQWLGLEEINNVDKRSMGGVTRRGFRTFGVKPLDNVLLKIAKIDKKRVFDVISFYTDYERSIANVSKIVCEKGIVVYVVGNRRVKGIEIPNDEITKRFFEKNNFKHIKTIIRKIPNKRMPKRNSPSNIAGITDSTMNFEYIVILQKEKC